MPFAPPSLPSNSNENFTFHAKITDLANESVILGVDEAGRGPVLGPMVYAVAYCPVSYKEDLLQHGYNDSKVLKESVRLEMFQEVCENKELQTKLGWATTAMSPLTITEGMLNQSVPYNLNEQAHDTTRDLIQLVLDANVDIAEVYVDTVGPPDKYEKKLKSLFPKIPKITVTKKADSLYPIVSLASICAKVTRDLCVTTQIGTNCGSGYPSDPNTVHFLKSSMDPIFGWDDYIRYSWQTADNILNQNGHKVNWDLYKLPAKPRKPKARIGLAKISLDTIAPVFQP